MSHFKERTEKICLNCNSSLEGRFCHKCGQENLEPKESVWHILLHVFNDITHFDGKLFNTLNLLLRRPGFLAAQYARGKRVSYLNPIRMYLFMSALFFLLFFTFFVPSHVVELDENATGDSAVSMLEKKRTVLTGVLASITDSVQHAVLEKKISETTRDIADLKKKQYTKIVDSSKDDNNDYVFELFPEQFQTREQYNASQDSLSPEKRDGFLKRKMKYKSFELDKKFRHDGKQVSKALGEIFLHSFPQLLFVSLPLFALLLKLLYYRRKEFYYVNHLIFALHLFIFSFSVLLVIFSLSKVQQWVDWSIFGYLQGLLWLGILFYLYKAMRNFYKQRRAKTIFKFILLGLSSLILLLFLFVVFFFYSVFRL